MSNLAISKPQFRRKRFSTARRPALVTIDSVATLQDLISGNLPRRVEIAEGLVGGSEKPRLQERLNKPLRACGCGEASIALIGSFLVLTGLAAVIPRVPWSTRGLIVLLGSVVTTLAVKMIALRRADTQFRGRVRDLLKDLQTRK